MKTPIEAYAFTLRKAREVDLYDFGGEPDLFEILSHPETGLVKFIDTALTKDVEAVQRTLKIPENGEENGKPVTYYGSDRNNRFLYGIIETGRYGKSYDISHKDNPKEILFKVEKSSAIMKPFFYLIKIPRRGNKAYMILERTENDSIFPLMLHILKGFLNNRFGAELNYQIEKENIITNEYLNVLADSQYHSVSMMVNQIPDDLADNYFNGFKSSEVSLELTIKFRSGMGGDRRREIKRMIDSGNTLFTSPDFRNVFDNSNKKVVADVPFGKTTKARTVYLNKENTKLRPYYEVEVRENNKGFSSFNSILEEVKKFIAHNEEFSIFD